MYILCDLRVGQQVFLWMRSELVQVLTKVLVVILARVRLKPVFKYRRARRSSSKPWALLILNVHLPPSKLHLSFLLHRLQHLHLLIQRKPVPLTEEILQAHVPFFSHFGLQYAGDPCQYVVYVLLVPMLVESEIVFSCGGLIMLGTVGADAGSQGTDRPIRGAWCLIQPQFSNASPLV